MSVSQRLAEWATSVTYSEIPRGTTDKAKEVILDGIGLALGAHGAPGMESLYRLLEERGGRAEASAWGRARSFPAPTAALYNGTAIHALDFDDIHPSAGTHVSAPVLPAAVSAAERMGRCSGERLLLAFVVGGEATIRLSQAALELDPGFLPTTLFGVFGAAIASSLVYELPASGMADAMGFAYAQASGNRQPVVERAISKRLQPGFASSSGIFASDLARLGLSAAIEPLEGQFGFGALYLRGQLDEDRLFGHLGDQYLFDGIALKAYPSCSSTHPVIDALLDLRRETSFEPGAVTSIEVRTTPTAAALVGRPFRLGRDPQVDAQFSNAYCAAATIIDGYFDLSSIEPSRVTSFLEAHELASKVTTVVDQTLDPELSDDQATVLVRLADGRVIGASVNHAKGTPQVPLTRDEMVDKFMRCTRAAPGVTESLQEQLIQSIFRLDEGGDSDRMLPLLVDLLGCAGVAGI